MQYKFMKIEDQLSDGDENFAHPVSFDPFFSICKTRLEASFHNFKKSKDFNTLLLDIC